VIVLVLIERRVSMHWGRALGFYLLWYGSGRAFLESLRIDPTEFYFLGLKINEDVALLAAVGGLALIIVQTVRHRGQDPEPIHPGPAEPEPLDADVSDSSDPAEAAETTPAES
jgi:prolipoprotein diacylglyceryltransferase